MSQAAVTGGIEEDWKEDRVQTAYIHNTFRLGDLSTSDD
jgi:hypothetical protein